MAGVASITLWDSYSGTFLGILGSFGQMLDIPGEINPAEGVPLDPTSGRATACPAGTLPPLGTEFVDMIPPEDTTLGSKVNTAATMASSVASTFAKKCSHLALFWVCSWIVLLGVSRGVKLPPSTFLYGCKILRLGCAP